MYAPTTDAEAQMLAGYIDSQLEAICASASGLTDEQARQRPARSELSLGGLLRHISYVLRNYTGSGRPTELDENAFEAFMDSFRFDERHSLAEVLAELAQLREATRERTLSQDLDEESMQPAAPWDGLPEMMATRRYEVLHLFEEVARHAGHADIIREQLDGSLVPQLEHAAAGREVWRPEA